MYSKLALVLALASAPLAAALSSGAGISPGGGNRLDSTSDPICTQAYNWSSNSLGQDPCLVAAILISLCQHGGYFQSQYLCQKYNIPRPGSFLDTTSCVCSSVFYEMISACVGCQGKPYSTFSDFIIYCPSENVTYGNFPLPIPFVTAVPSWAYQSPKDNNDWYNAPLAQKIGDKPENKPLSKPTGVSNYSPPKASCSGGPPNDLGGSSSKKKSSTAAIAGGVVGGVVAVGAVGAIAVIVVGKMGATAGMGAAASAGTAGGGGGGASGAGTGFAAGMATGHTAGTAFGGAHAGAAAYGGAQAPWAAHGAGMVAPGAQAPFAGQAAGAGAAYGGGGGGASASVGPGAVMSPGASAGFAPGGVTASGIPMGAAAPMGPGVGGAGAAIGPASYGGASHGVTFGSGPVIDGAVGAAGVTAGTTSVWGKLFGSTRRTRRDVEEAGQGNGPNMSTTNADTFGLLNAPGPGAGLPQQQSPYPTPSNITYPSQGSPGIPQQQQGTPSGTPLQTPQQLPSTQTPYYQSYFSGAQPGTPA